MLTSTFVLLNGLGPAMERRLWEIGVTDWANFLQQSAVPTLSAARKSWYDQDLLVATSQLEAGRAAYFGTCLKSRDHWRLYGTFRHRALYLDIETTGLPAGVGQVTVIGLYRNGGMTSLIHGENLAEEYMEAELEQTDILVTFFGRGFDIPYLRATYPRLKFDKPHFDLCFAARRLGLRGGLKGIEREMLIERDSTLEGLDGWDAVRLWHQWRRGDTSSLELLLRYNTADTKNLEPLADLLFDRMVTQYGPPSVGIQAGKTAPPSGTP
ncbi:hypothetical protein W02_41760 [Nitrospira sp. KM1]|uniref:ribonuclease H-like domain-containing protein n=1 Tax=Nitrospira sp. KM1 TaxID=1936990 RepID=UPI0013A77825|nr:ribonuclease H-like domain-containing protein [Nitrospira sp. KM1]BCA57036.1 hypothetical protein W02_41760 [Nitrospira sp. KM1]